MTVFILVSGVFTGGHVWERTAGRLTAAGATAHAVTLTGMTGPEPTGVAPARDARDTDLETHVADVVRAIDAVPADAAGDGIVLVGHDYGIHPAVGAADRRADRVRRVVYLDSGMPMDGVPALAAIPDQGVRDALVRRAGEGTAGPLAPPADPEEWQRWGSTAGVPAAALDRLTALAAPQPAGTLLQPLVLTGAVKAVPTTGVLCTLNGPDIAMLEALVGFGEPALQALVDPRVTFFELPTGHWPMLSCPDEVAGVLLAAAADEGHRLAPAAAEVPGHLRPFALDVPERPRERSGNVDLYLPDTADGQAAPLPAVVIVHGGPVPAEVQPTPRDWPTIGGYARLAAEHGVVGVTLDHRLHDLADFERAAGDVAAAVERVRADPRVDGDRIALWFFSGGSPMSADWLGAPPAWLRCLAATYPVMDPLPNWGLADSRFHPARALPAAGDLPVVLTRAGLEQPVILETVDAFLAAAEECGARVEVVEVPNGHHGFETLDPTDESRDAIRRSMAAVLAHLKA
ncbi:alpha/beta hydrolase [Streptomyces sp. NPDC101118]|uniref:alpha/beta hydrolase n=1 Tax=Streptomyces sp. NPDC101118 TaxID=3366109 RepID=UPI0037FC0016